MKGFRFRRGLVGDVMERRDANSFGFYRFEFDVPKYKWSLDQQKGEEFAAMVEGWIRGPIEKVLVADAKKLDMPLGFIRDAASCSFGGIGARDLKDDGTPDWGGVSSPQPKGEPKGHHHTGAGRSLFDEYWTMVRAYDSPPSAIEDAKASAIDIGDNFQAKEYITKEIPFPKSRDDSKPFFLQWTRWVWNVHTVEIGLLGPLARKFFEKGDTKRDKHRLEAIRATRTFTKRSEAAKKAWKARKKSMRKRAELDRANRVELKRIRKSMETLMYRDLLAILALDEAIRGNKRKGLKAKLLKLEQAMTMYAKLMGRK